MSLNCQTKTLLLLNKEKAWIKAFQLFSQNLLYDCFFINSIDLKRTLKVHKASKGTIQKIIIYKIVFIQQNPFHMFMPKI